MKDKEEDELQVAIQASIAAAAPSQAGPSSSQEAGPSSPQDYDPAFVEEYLEQQAARHMYDSD